MPLGEVRARESAVGQRLGVVAERQLGDRSQTSDPRRLVVGRALSGGTLIRRVVRLERVALIRHVEATYRTIQGASWAVLALARTRRQLRRGGLDAVCLTEPPDLSPEAQAGVGAVLRRSRATCLTRALVRQRWLAARGTEHDVVIGVSRADGFAAHAWLDGDPDGGFVELARHPGGAR